MAIEGEHAAPRVPAPASLRPVLGFSRLSAAAYSIIQRAIDDDGVFRARVADAADEDEVGRAGWLWLHRPVDWADDPALRGASPPPATRGGEGGGGSKGAARAKETARLKQAAADADAAKRRTSEQLAEARRATAGAIAERDDLAARLQVALEERNAAVRRTKALEADLASTRRDLKLARAATREAEAELLELRRTDAVVAPPPAAGPTPTDRPPAPDRSSAPAPVEAWDRTGTARAIGEAASAAASLAASLASAASALQSPMPSKCSEPAVVRQQVGTAPVRPSGGGRRRSTRRPPGLPPGVFDGTPEADRHLVTDGANLVLVDGYNLARTAWSGLSTEEERRRTVALLEEVQARSGGRVLVAFDGDDDIVGPVASTKVQVRYSATGQTADDLIADILTRTEVAQPVLVVSSDRAVADDARRRGAAVLSSRAFLAAAGR